MTAQDIPQSAPIDTPLPPLPYVPPMVKRAIAFLTLIHPLRGHLVGFVKNGETRRQFAFETPEELVAWQQPYDLKGFDCYHCCSTVIDATRKRGLRKRDNIHASSSLWFEVDSRSSKPDAFYADRGEAMEATAEFIHKAKLPPPVWVYSGGGPQIYLPFAAELPPDQWLDLARGLRGACEHFNFHADPTRTCDVTSILRTPRTRHQATGLLIQVQVQAPISERYPLEAYEHLRQYAGAKRSSVPVTNPEHLLKANSGTSARPDSGRPRIELRNVDPAPPWSPYEDAKLRSALAHRDAAGKRVWNPDDGYPVWGKQVAPAIASLGWGEKGEDIFVWFSRQTTKPDYFPGDARCREVVRSYTKPRGPDCVTEATIYKKALDAGWSGEPDPAVLAEFTGSQPAVPQGDARLNGAGTTAEPDAAAHLDVAQKPFAPSAVEPRPIPMQPNARAQPTLKSVRASTIEPAAIDWLWPDRFALGKLGIVAGLPGEGKGQIFAYLAARVTHGLDWPCGEGYAPMGNVILMSSEDDASDTIVPRLIAAGADLNCIEILSMVREGNKDRMFNLATDLALLRQKIAEVGNVKLVLIDPISAYLGVGKVDSFRTTDVRAVLAPLVDLASDLKAAVIGIMHFNKKVDVTNALLRISDSLAFGATARHVYAVVDDPENKRKLFVKGKNNLARDVQALAYNISTATVGQDRTGKKIEAPHIAWHVGHVDVTASEALQAATENKTPAARDAAKKFLMTLLSSGPVAKKEIDDAAEGEGISKRTLERAKRELGIIAKKDAPDGGWTWRLPVPSHPTTASRH